MYICVTKANTMYELKAWADENVRPQFNDASEIGWAVRYLIDKIGLERTKKLPRKEVVKLAGELMPYVNEALSKPRLENCTYIF
jgi:hypothetical protein